MRRSVGKDHRELFAAVARGDVTRAKELAHDCRGDKAQAVVAALMAERIIILFEVVDIEQQSDIGDPLRRALHPLARPQLLPCQTRMRERSNQGRRLISEN